MHQLVYASRARQPFSQADLQSMLIKFRAANSDLGITGLLVHSCGTFIQLLEGEQHVVAALYGRIEQDTRHFDCCLVDVSFPRRMFGDWAMAFEDLTGAAGTSMAGSIPLSLGIDLRLIDHSTILELFSFMSEQHGIRSDTQGAMPNLVV